MAKIQLRGFCQVCGREQAVNQKTGKIAHHGYTVEFGAFEGTCMGAKEQPIQTSVEVANKVEEILNERIAKAEKEYEFWNTTTPETYPRKYILARVVEVIENLEFKHRTYVDKEVVAADLDKFEMSKLISSHNLKASRYVEVLKASLDTLLKNKENFGKELREVVKK